MDIKLRYRAVDGCSSTKTFKTLKGARRFAAERVGEHPDVDEGSRYAVSFDGIGTLYAEGVTWKELFPPYTGELFECDFCHAHYPMDTRHVVDAAPSAKVDLWQLCQHCHPAYLNSLYD